MDKSNDYKHVFINDWANWFAVDESGRGYEYEDVPLMNSSTWSPYFSDSRVLLVPHDSGDFWGRSLQKRIKESVRTSNDYTPIAGTFIKWRGASDTYWNRAFFVGFNQHGDMVMQNDSGIRLTLDRPLTRFFFMPGGDI